VNRPRVAVDKWQIFGILLVLVGVTLLAILEGFIVKVLVDLLQLLGVFVGIGLIVIGIILLSGRHFMRRRGWSWGAPAAST
jgi:hypothetical protein